MFDSTGERGPPCGVPSSAGLTSPFSITPARKNARISFSNRLSLTLSAIFASNRSWLTRNTHGFRPKRSAQTDPAPLGRSARTALDHSEHLGWAEIRHPFHPLLSQRFQVLKKRCVGGIDTLILRNQECGTFSVAREWTDWADPSPYGALGLPPQRLDANSLLELAFLLEQLTNKVEKRDRIMSWTEILSDQLFT